MRIILASEISEYVFCHRAWWMRRVHGVPSANVTELRAGTRAHVRHRLVVFTARWLQFMGYALGLVAMLVALRNSLL